MLELKSICKEYPAGGSSVKALRGIDLQFRENEFVSILGPSGCGKTTMLNIIGGLDQYSAGDLIINGRSTKDFKDRDWDSYRNHTIGFVFQSYHLIPHQTVLQNVELSLALSGVSRSERRRRAIEALEKVGLSDQLRKKPSEMSGGQMQRVAIARAIVNNPDIILADEPTGALDTETSVQVMDILKEIARDRLVIMVTHNPELAQQYSTRIIRMLDGKIIGDSNPISKEEICPQKASKEKAKKTSMSFFTSFSLSLKNLFTKKGRTVLTSFAGSIGIIGIALIYAVSQGTTNYINTLQEETLSSYPLTLEATSIDLSTLISTFSSLSGSGDASHEKDAVYSKSVMFDMIDALTNVETTENDLKSFKSYLTDEIDSAEEEAALPQALSGVQYSYPLDLLVYTKNVDGSIIRSDSNELLSKAIAENMGMDMTAMSNAGSSSSFSSMMSSRSSNKLWVEMLSGKDGEPVSPLLKKQYDLVYGSWPSAYNEIVLVVDENNELDDLTLYAMGLESKEEIDDVFQAVNDGKELNTEAKNWSYENICSTDFRVILNSSCWKEDAETGLYTDLRETDTGLQYLYDNALTLKVTGIIRPNEDASATMLNGSIAYTVGLTEYVINEASSSSALKAQRNSPDTDILSGLPFKNDSDSLSDSEKQKTVLQYVSTLSEEEKAAAYTKMVGTPTQEQLDAAVAQSMAAMTAEEKQTAMLQAMQQQTGMSEAELASYIASMSQEDLDQMFVQMIQQQLLSQMAAETEQRLSAMSPGELSAMLDETLASADTATCASLYETLVEFSDSTYEDNLTALGNVSLAEPSTIYLYASSFENKDIIEDAITRYNDSVDELHQIHYTDYVGLIMSSVTLIIQAITYVLIAFVAISLIVSSIMIGVITLISVQERTKEIGILRAIGASKRDVSSMFNAETVIIGFTSGLLGIVITYLLCIPINLVIHKLTGIQNLNAFLPPVTAAILIFISVLLTLLAGIIPSASAAKKDPVVALRTE